MVASASSTSCAISKMKEGVDCWGYDYQNKLISWAPSDGWYSFIGSGQYFMCAVHAVTNKMECWGVAGSYTLEHANNFQGSILDPDECDSKFFFSEIVSTFLRTFLFTFPQRTDKDLLFEF